MSILKISPHKPMTLIWWFKNRSQIDFSPPYQRRGRLWSVSDKAFFVDSILNGFDIPKLYLADFQFGSSSLNRARLPYAIIDGKQRLEAVFDFFENRFTLASNFRYRKLPGLQIAGLSLRDLKKGYSTVADEFENASLDIMSVFAEEESDIHEIFIRLNRSKPLTGAEVRNAIVGPVSDVIRTLASHDFFAENISFGVIRAGDLNAAAKVLLFEYEDKLVATKKTNLDAFANDKSIDRNSLELASRRVIDTLDILEEIFIPKDKLLSSSGIFQVYYWFTKGVNAKYHGSIREFLVYFEQKRWQNREYQKTEDESVLDPELARYDTLNRSTNDQSSHEGRIEILDSNFRRWMVKNPDFRGARDLFVERAR